MSVTGVPPWPTYCILFAPENMNVIKPKVQQLSVTGGPPWPTYGILFVPEGDRRSSRTRASRWKIDAIARGCQAGSRISTSMFISQIQFSHHPKENRFVRIFCEDAGRVLRSQDLNEVEVCISEALLNPEVADGQMANLAQAAAPRDSNGSR